MEEEEEEEGAVVVVGWSLVTRSLPVRKNDGLVGFGRVGMY